MKKKSLLPFRPLARLLAVLALCAGSFAHANADEIDRLIATADTYFWFGVSERGNVDAFDKARVYLDRAEAAVRAAPLDAAQRSRYRARIEQAARDLAAQREVHFDTLYGVFPLARFFGVSLFQSARATGSFELVDDPSVMAATWAAELMASVQETNLMQVHQLNTLVHSVPYDPALENEVFYVLQTRSDFFLHSKENLLRLVGEADPLPDLSNARIPDWLVGRAIDAIDADGLFVVTVTRQPSEPDDRFYIVDGDFYQRGSERPVQHSSLYGFSRDRRDQLLPILILHLVLAVLAQLYALATSYSVRGVAGSSSVAAVFRFQVITLLVFLLGRIIPWGILPTLATLLPLAENLAILSFWWVTLVGVVLFAGPALPVRVLQNPRIKLVERLDPRINAVVVAAALGSCAFLVTPALAYYRSDAYPLLAAIIVAGTGISRFTWLCLDRYVLEIPPSYTLVALLLAGLAGLAALALSTHWLFVIAALAWGVVLVQTWVYNRRNALRGRVRKDDPVRQGGDFLLPGQQQVMDELSALANATQARQLCVAAGAGRGKSHIAEWLYDSWPHQNARYLAICTEENRGTPYHAIFEALELNDAPHSGPAAAVERDAGLVDAGVGRFLDPLSTWFGDEQGPVQLQRPGTVHPWLYGNLFPSTTKFRPRETPLLLVIDNAQWLDDPSAEFLRFALQAARRDRRILILVHVRNGVPEMFDGTIIDDIDTAWAQLDGTQRAVVLREFLVSAERIVPDSAQVLVAARRWHQIADGTDGRPARDVNLIQQARIEIKHWKDIGILQRASSGPNAGMWELDDRHRSPERIPSPPGKRAIIRERTDTEPELHTIIGMASCLGSQFDSRLIATAAGMDQITCLQTLKTFERETALICEAPGGEGDFEFTTPGAYMDARYIFGLDLAVDSTPALTREYCRRLAEGLRGQDIQEGERLRMRAELLRHSGRGLATEYAEACLQYARYNRRNFQFAEAREQLASARSQLADMGRDESDLATQIEAEDILALAEWARIHPEERGHAIKCADRHLAIKSRVQAGELRMTLAAAAARALLGVGERERAQAIASDLEAEARDHAAPFFISEALYFLAACTEPDAGAALVASLGRLEESGRLLRASEGDSAVKLLADVEFLHGTLLAQRGEPGDREAAASHLEQAVMLYGSRQDATGTLRAREALARIALDEKAPDRAAGLAQLEWALAVARELHDGRRIATLANWIAELHLQAGETAAALDDLSQAAAESHQDQPLRQRTLDLLQRCAAQVDGPEQQARLDQLLEQLESVIGPGTEDAAG